MVGTKVVIYGLSTEGYGLAAQLAIGGADVYVIDESASSAFSLNVEIAKKYSVSSIKEDDLLLDVIPIDIVVSDAKYLFFTPRVRKSGDDTKTEINSKFKDAVSALKKDSAVVFGLPTCFGGSVETITLLEHITGFEVGNQISYFYYPLEDIDQQPHVIGSFNANPDPTLNNLLSINDQSKKFVTIPSSEYFHGMNVLSKFLNLSSMLEITKHVREDAHISDFVSDDLGNVFLDDMLDGLFDLRLLQSSFEGQNTMTFLFSGINKSLDYYIKLLIDQIRSTLKDYKLKASRTKLVLLWNIDQYSIRNNKTMMLHSLRTKLRDYIGDVEIRERLDFDPFHMDKTTMVVTCSNADFDYMMKVREDYDIIIIKANPFCQVVR